MMMMVAVINDSLVCHHDYCGNHNDHLEHHHNDHQDSGQCKPSYGSCEITCDCLDNFGMASLAQFSLCDFFQHVTYHDF